MIRVISATGQRTKRALKQLKHRGPNAVWYMISTWEASEMDTVYEFLREIQDQDISPSNTSRLLTKLPTMTSIASRSPKVMPNVDDPTVNAWSQVLKHPERLVSIARSRFTI